MTVRTLGAEVVKRTDTDLLIRIPWRDGNQRGQSLRIVHPLSRIERFLFTKGHLTPRTLKRVSLLAYLLIPVLILLNTVVPQIPAIPYLLTLSVSAVLFVVALAAGLWFYFGASLVDRLEASPLRAMAAPAVPAPQWWSRRMDEVSPEAMEAHQRAYLAHAVTEERIERGRSLQGRFSPSQASYGVLALGLEFLTARRRRLAELLAVESVEEEHLAEMLRVAEAPGVPAERVVATAPMTAEVRDWVEDN